MVYGDKVVVSGEVVVDKGDVVMYWLIHGPLGSHIGSRVDMMSGSFI